MLKLQPLVPRVEFPLVVKQARGKEIHKTKCKARESSKRIPRSFYDQPVYTATPTVFSKIF